MRRSTQCKLRDRGMGLKRDWMNEKSKTIPDRNNSTLDQIRSDHRQLDESEKPNSS